MIKSFYKFKEYYRKMKSIRLVVVSMVFAAVFAISAMAQTTQNAKIALINTQAFYTEGGITKVLNGLKRLETEMKPMIDQRNAKFNEYSNLRKSLSTLAENRNKNIPVKDEDIQAKGEQLQNLEKEIKRMDEDIKAKEEKRRFEILQPINDDISNSIGDFAKQKGYTMVMEIAILANAGAVLWADSATNITKDFIAFYNAKPAGTATK